MPGSNCRHRDAPCEYEESLADKYAYLHIILAKLSDLNIRRLERTTSLILEKLNRVEANIGQLSSSEIVGSSDDLNADFREQARRQIDIWRSPHSLQALPFPSPGDRPMGRVYGYRSGIRGPLTVPHKIMLWPKIRDRMLSASSDTDPDLSQLWDEGSPWFIKHDLRARSSMPLINLGLPDPALTPETGDRRSLFFRDFKLTQALEYTDAYFDTFNMLFPLLNRRRFMDEVVNHVVQKGYPDYSWRGVIALLVFALGQMAVEGTLHPPLTTVESYSSGVRGGSVRLPPGLHNFTEARRRLSLLPINDTLEKVQSSLLQAIYFQCSSQHVEYWHSIVSASMLCRLLVMCRVHEWESAEGDLIKRAYWTCVLHEEFFHVDMDLPSTAVVTMEDDVPMPHFYEMQEQTLADYGRQSQHDASMAYFLAMITLRRIVGRMHEVLDESEGRSEYSSAPNALLAELSRQLDAWRNALPRSLRWLDSDLLRTAAQTEMRPVDGRSGLEIVTTMLQARYYQTRITVHLLYVYRALHEEQPISIDDANGFVAAIRSACDLALVMTRLQGKKRLVPHQFTWIQSFTGMLLILHVIAKDPQLRSLCEEGIPQDRLESAETIMLQWLRDIKQVDGIADWSFKILEPMYLPDHHQDFTMED